RVRQVDVHQLAAHSPQQRNPCFHLFPYSGVHPCTKILFWDTDFHSFDRFSESRRIISHRRRRRSGIVGVAPCNDLQHLRHIGHVVREWTNAIQRRRKRNQPISRHPPI